MTDYKITYHFTAPRTKGTAAPNYHDYLPATRLGLRVTALVASGYVITRIAANTDKITLSVTAIEADHDFLPIAHLGQRVTALVTSGYIITRIEKSDIKDSM